jgi:hypothetical protein
VMDTRFGGSSAGLLQRLRSATVGVADLREVADHLLPTLATTRLRLDLVQRSGAGSVVVLEEDERMVRVHLSDLADQMTRAGVRPTTPSISAALASWVAHRPVTDAAAATAGITVLDWRDRAETAVGWQVVVRRGNVAVVWRPLPTTDATDIARTRAAATGRAKDVVLDLRIEGPVALWTHRAVPLLATSALVDPERMVAKISSGGLALPDMHVVVTPHRPVACAMPGVAARLAGQTTEAGLTLPWSRLADLPWL